MAQRRKSRTTAAPSRGREYKIRLPEDVARRIEAKAKAEGRPQNRIIINELAAFPDLEAAHAAVGGLQGLRDHYEVTLAKYSARIVVADLADELLRAVDMALEAGSRELEARLAKLRVVRSAMLKHEKTAKQ
jgi:hypothetical protein